MDDGVTYYIEQCFLEVVLYRKTKTCHLHIIVVHRIILSRDVVKLQLYHNYTSTLADDTTLATASPISMQPTSLHPSPSCLISAVLNP